MLIQNVNSAVSGFASDGGPAPVASPSLRAAPAEVRQSPAGQVAQPTSEQLKGAVEAINRALQQNGNANVQFSIDGDTKQTVVKVVDSQNGQVIRQFPSQEILAVSRMIAEAQRGVLLRQKV